MEGKDVTIYAGDDPWFDTGYDPVSEKASTSSSVFTLMVRDLEGTPYHDRCVNVLFEEYMLKCMKHTQVSVGTMIRLECPFVVDMVEFVRNGSIRLWATEAELPKIKHR